MLLRSLVVALVLTNATTSVAAQATKEQENLKRLLEEKYGTSRSRNLDQSAPRTRGLAGTPAPNTTTPSPPASGDLLTIKPDGTIKPRSSNEGAQPERRSDLGDGLWAQFAAAVLPRAWAQAPAAPPGAPSAMVAARDSFVIQLNPNVTSQQIDDLVRKYDLNVTKHVPSLGVLYVEQKPETRQRTRSLTPNAPDTLKSVLEPKVILDLRSEPSVSAAFVNTTVAPKSIPRPSSTRVNQSGMSMGWTWQEASAAQPDDGNWGLKVMRMPAVWTILDRARKANPNRPSVTLSFLDSGFGAHKQMVYGRVYGTIPPIPQPIDCGRSHGTHVAGIVGATHGSGSGIDGMVPAANVDILPITHELLTQSATDGTDTAQQHVSFFMDAITDLAEYLQDNPVAANERRVVNISLAYNWFGVALVSQRNPTDDRVIRDQIRQHAKVVQTLVNFVQDRVLFVAAAGNDSDGSSQPVSAEFATPFAYAALQAAQGARAAKNIIVVEARGRDGSRPGFSNIGGHVAAPGVDILSTIASSDSGYAVCSGTSQAAPHVTALAGILFELAPTKTPAEIIEIIAKSSRSAISPGAAPRVDALEAVLRVAPDPKLFLRYLADLNGDGKVDADDLLIFKAQLTEIEAAKNSEEPFTSDLNGDGVVDGRERCYPRIDLNGSGRASYDPADMQPILGVRRSDLDVMELAWTGTTDFKTAMQETGLQDVINAWTSTASVRTLPPSGTKRPCNALR
jgi:subtilisin family serine protease